MNLFNRLLIKYSLRPYKTTKLPTGVSVSHYKNGRIIVTKS